jgi:hypothetical protein
MRLQRVEKQSFYNHNCIITQEFSQWGSGIIRQIAP